MTRDHSAPPGLGIADAHSDLLSELVVRGFRRGEDDPFGAHWLPNLRAGGVALQVCALYADLDVLPEGALRTAMTQVAAFERTLRLHAGAVIAVRRKADLDVAGRDGPIGLLLALEGAEALGNDPWLLETFWALGVRMVGLTWNRRNPFADGAGERGGGGLSELGRRLVDLCVKLGVAIDLAHASERTFWDVLERAAGSPILCSHAGCRAVYDHPRNLGDEQLRALAEAGGVLGVMQHPLGIDPERPTIDRVVDHVEHALAVMGTEHVASGSDFGRQIARALGWRPPPDALMDTALPPDAAIDGLGGPEDFPQLVAGLRRRGLEGDVLERVLAGNLLRFLRGALPA